MHIQLAPPQPIYNVGSYNLESLASIAVSDLKISYVDNFENQSL